MAVDQSIGSVTSTPLSGASPLPHLGHLEIQVSAAHGAAPCPPWSWAARCCETPHGGSRTALGQCELGLKCGRGLAPDGGGSVDRLGDFNSAIGASPLPHLDHLEIQVSAARGAAPCPPWSWAARCCETPRGGSRTALGQCELGLKCGRGLAPDGGGSVDRLGDFNSAIGGKPPPTFRSPRDSS